MLILFDSFSDVAGTAITAHTGDVQAVYTAHPFNAGSAVITGGGRLRPNTAAAQALYFSAVSPASADYDVLSDVTVLSSLAGAAAGPAGRMVATGFYLARLNQTTGNLELYLNNGGGFTLLSSVTSPQTVGATYRLKLQLRGNAITALVSSDGGITFPVSCTATDSTLTSAGNAGFQLFGLGSDTTGYHLDNLTCVDFNPTTTCTVTADDPNLLFSGTWAQSWLQTGGGVGVAARAKTINAGAMFEMIVGQTATCKLCFDVSGVAFLSAPTLWVEVDAIGAYYTLPANGVVTLTFPSVNGFPTTSGAAKTHRIRCWAAGVYEGNYAAAPQGAIDQWTQQYGALVFQGLILDAGGVTLPTEDVRPIIRFTGDSLTASVHLFRGNPTDQQSVMDAHLYWPNQVANALGLRLVAAGFGSQGVAQNNGQHWPGGNASGNVPLAGQTFGLACSGTAYALPSAPLVEVISLGSNDAFWLSANPGSLTGTLFQTAYTALLQRVRTANPGGIIFCLAFVGLASGSPTDLRPSMAAAVAAMNDSRVVYLDYSALYTSADTTEGVHLSVGGSNKVAARLGADIASQLGLMGVRYGPKAGGNFGNGRLAL